MLRQFSFHGITNEGDRIRNAVGFLTGPAFVWWNTLASPPTDWAGLDTGLRARFQPVTSDEVARNKLHALEQGKLSINEYVSRFRQISVLIPGMDAASLMFQFVRGLKPSLQMQHRANQPADLEAAIALAVRMGYHMGAPAAPSVSHQYGGEAAMDLSAIRSSLPFDETEPAEYASEEVTVTRGELAQLLAAIHRNNGSGSNGRGAQGASGGFRPPRSLPTITGMSADKVKEYMDAGKCFSCGSTEHRSRQCDKKRSDQTAKKKSGEETARRSNV